MHFVMDCITSSLVCYVIATRCHKAFLAERGIGHTVTFPLTKLSTKAGYYL